MSTPSISGSKDKMPAPTTSTMDYSSWLEKHMPAFEIMNTLKSGPVGVFLDYDGTLAAIVNDSNKAFMTTEMANTLKEVANTYPTAVVSGRAKDKVKDFVKLENISYAGSHGVDILIPARLRADGKATDLSFKAASRNIYDEMRKVLKSLEVVLKIPNTKLEDNSYSVTVHYREVDSQDHEPVRKITEAVVQQYPSLHVEPGNMVWEVKGPNGNKGDAIEFLMDNVVGLKGKATPLFIGDDKTDEPGFKAVNKLGGISIIVSKIPKDTSAKYSLTSPVDVQKFLAKLVKRNKD